MADSERVERLQQKRWELKERVLEYLTPDQKSLNVRIGEIYQALKEAYSRNCLGGDEEIMQDAIDVTPGGRELHEHMQWIARGLELSPYFIELTYPEDPDDGVKR